MDEESINPSQDTEETETSAAGQAEQNNTSNASEGANTQKNGRTAQDRIRDLIAENKRLKSQTADNSSASQGLPEDKLWKAKIETRLSAPEHIKPKADEIASYAAKYGVPIEDAISLFDSRNKVSQEEVNAANAANTEASQSRTGGTANPAARTETPEDPAKWTDKELDAELERRINSGEKL
jgi:hypothetical protein